MELAPQLAEIVKRLLAESEETARVGLDQIGAAIGTVRVDVDDVDAILRALEAAGRTIDVGPQASGVATLRIVIPGARALSSALGRAPTVAEITEATGVDEAEVRQALLLARVMGRG